MIRIQGLDAAMRKLQQVQAALIELNKPVALQAYDCDDLMSLHAAIAHIEQQIEDRIRQFAGNAQVAEMGSVFKKRYYEKLVGDANRERMEKKGSGMQNLDPMSEDLRQVENAVHDMQLIDHQSADSQFEILAHLLESENFKGLPRELSDAVDLNGWLAAGRATQGSMAGSAKLRWPVKLEERLGLMIALIRAVANKSISLSQFTHEFYYSGSTITSGYRKFVVQAINPFHRDFRDYVNKTLGAPMVKKSSETTQVQTFNFHNSHIAAVQTGSQSIANVNMNTTVVGLRLTEALDEVAKALLAVDRIEGHEKHEILELVEESKQEVAKEVPNKSKLRTYLATIGGALGTAANFKPAYELLVAAAAAAGYTLPALG